MIKAVFGENEGILHKSVRTVSSSTAIVLKDMVTVLEDTVAVLEDTVAVLKAMLLVVPILLTDNSIELYVNSSVLDSWVEVDVAVDIVTSSVVEYYGNGRYRGVALAELDLLG